jgi:hypothetical protein
MAAIYTISMMNQTIAADATLVLFHTAADVTARGSIIQIMRVSVGQLGTDTSDQIGVVIGEKAAPFGIYTPTTPAPHNLGGPPSGIVGGNAGAQGTAGTNASAEGEGAVTVTIADTFNNLSGYRWSPTHEERIWIAVDTALVVKIVGTPKSLVGWWASLTYDEIT